MFRELCPVTNEDSFAFVSEEWIDPHRAGTMQALVLNIGLAPLRRLAQQVRAVEQGDQDSLSDDQPEELRALSSNMNHLIRFGRTSLERHRNALADLAHALKTPLAVLRGVADDLPETDTQLKHTLNDSVERMNDAISYRLRRASTVGNNQLSTTIDVRALAQRLRETFMKVYADKALTLDVDGQASVKMDSGDLTELLGNLLDNACKWGQHAVSVKIDIDAERGLHLVIEDDGPGITPEQRDIILERGVRADEHTPGQGLGLALVRELVVTDYHGTIDIDQSPLGGAMITVCLKGDL